MSNRHIPIPVFHNHRHFHLDHHYSLNVKASSSVSIPYRLPNHVPFLPSGSWWHCHDDDNRKDDLHNENDHGDGNDVEDQNLSMNRVQLDAHCSDLHRDSGRWTRAWSRRSRSPGLTAINNNDNNNCQKSTTTITNRCPPKACLISPFSMTWFDYHFCHNCFTPRTKQTATKNKQTNKETRPKWQTCHLSARPVSQRSTRTFV